MNCRLTVGAEVETWSHNALNGRAMASAAASLRVATTAPAEQKQLFGCCGGDLLSVDAETIGAWHLAKLASATRGTLGMAAPHLSYTVCRL